MNPKLSEAKLKHFCDKFAKAVFEFVATEEKKIDAEEIDKMSFPSDEVIESLSHNNVLSCVANVDFKMCLYSILSTFNDDFLIVVALSNCRY